jgi:hypothetical protein
MPPELADPLAFISRALLNRRDGEGPGSSIPGPFAFCIVSARQALIKG